MALGDEVGRVSIRVIPDTTKFRDDLQKALGRIERTTKLNIQASVDLARSSIENVRRQVEGVEATIVAKVDQPAIREMREQIEDIRPKVTVDAVADTEGARTMLAALTRPRVATIHARVSSASVATATAALARLSGARVLGDMFENVGEALANLDRSVPKLSAIATGISTISGAALASISSVMTLGASFLSIGGAALALPGILAGFGVGLGVTIAAAKDAATVLADLGPAFTGLQDSISARFWERAAQPIRDLVNGLLPQLQSSLENVSSAIGGFAGEWATLLEGALGGGVLEGMMGNLAESIDIAKGALDPLVEAFTTLGVIGSEYLPRMADWFVRISDQFNGFIQDAAESGQLQDWIDGGIAALQDLGRVLGASGEILAGFASAAEAAGGASLGALADGLGRVADIVNGPAFQGALTTIFEGAHAAVEGLGRALGPLGDMFVDLAPTIATVLELGGQIIGDVLGGIADALNQPAFADGLVAFFEGIEDGVAAILPSLPEIAELLGTIGEVAGTLAGVLGEVLGAAFEALAPVVEEILKAVEPLLPMLGDILVQAIEDLSPLLLTIAQDILPPLVEMFGQLLPIIEPLVQILVDSLAPILEDIAPLFEDLVPLVGDLVEALVPFLDILAERVGPTIENLMPVVEETFGAIVDIIKAAMPLIIGILQVATGILSGDWDLAWKGVGNITSGAWETIKAIVNGGMRIAGGYIEAGLASIEDWWNDGWGRMQSFLARVFPQMGSATNGGMGGITGFVLGGLATIISNWNSTWSNIQTVLAGAWAMITSTVGSRIAGVVSFFQSLPGQIVGALAGIAGTMAGVGADIVNGLIAGIRNMGGGAIEAITGVVGGVIAAAKAALDSHSPSRVFIGLGEDTGDGYIIGVENKAKAAQTSMRNLLTPPRALSYGLGDVTPAAGASGGGEQIIFNGNVGWMPDEVAERIEVRKRRAHTVAGMNGLVFA